MFTVSSEKVGTLYITLVNEVLNHRDLGGDYYLIKPNFPILQLLANSSHSFLEGKVMCAVCIPNSRYQQLRDHSVKKHAVPFHNLP